MKQKRNRKGTEQKQKRKTKRKTKRNTKLSLTPPKPAYVLFWPYAGLLACSTTCTHRHTHHPCLPHPPT